MNAPIDIRAIAWDLFQKSQERLMAVIENRDGSPDSKVAFISASVEKAQCQADLWVLDGLQVVLETIP